MGPGDRTVAGEDPAFAGQAIYSRRFLALYDALVYGFNSPVLWRCSKARMVELYDEHVSARHLDVGVGSGGLLDACRFPAAAPEVTLMDMNPNSLAVTAARLARHRPRTVTANALAPWPVEAASFDSVALSHLVHCLPGAIPEKAAVFEHARTALAPGGTLFGATILGRGVDLSRPARLMTAVCNRRGVLSNRDDDPADLDAVLARVFDAHELRIRGAVGLFSARAAA